MLSLDNPALDWVSMARGMGVDGGHATTAEQFVKLLAHGFATHGPFLIEAAI
jgi:acetolactate synthase-1/2/3 large subunit